MSSVKKGKGRCSDDTMDDDSDEKDTKRKSRNLSEKKRRDQFNLLVNELSSMVSSGGRKMDKSTVLKSTISFLKNHNESTVRSRIHEIQEDWKPSFLTNEEFTHLVLEAVDGFIMVFSTSGQIFYASESITSLLGHLPNEVINMTIYEMTCEEEQNNLYNALLSPVSEEAQISFSCHLRKGGSSPKHRNYFELVNFLGYFRSDVDVVQPDSKYSSYTEEADTRLVFVGTGRLHTPQLIRAMSLADSSKSEFTSRHSLEWKFLFLDHRAPPIIGYLPFELLGTSGYDYYHVDDLDKVVNCHESLMQKGEGTSCYYRFLTKGQQWIWLQTRFYITYHQWNAKPEFIVCTHRVVSYVEVLKHSRKEQDGIPADVLDGRSPSFGSSAPAPWPSKSHKGRYSQEVGSDCTSRSADSPVSKFSVRTQQSVRSRASQNTQTSANQANFQQQQQQQFSEPSQYAAAMPIQQAITNFPAPTVLSPLTPMDMPQEQTTLHADLQRKHAELQASIGQQQAQLRMVSEQLLMARLGILPAQAQPDVGPASNTDNVTTSYSYSTSGTVSSTTATLAAPAISAPVLIATAVPSSAQSDILTPMVVVSSTLSAPQVCQHQPNALYSPPDSNTPPHLAELK